MKETNQTDSPNPEMLRVTAPNEAASGNSTTRHNWRPMDTIDQMENLVLGMVGRRLKYNVLIGHEPPAETQLAMF